MQVGGRRRTIASGRLRHRDSESDWLGVTATVPPAAAGPWPGSSVSEWRQSGGWTRRLSDGSWHCAVPQRARQRNRLQCRRGGPARARGTQAWVCAALAGEPASASDSGARSGRLSRASYCQYAGPGPPDAVTCHSEWRSRAPEYPAAACWSGPLQSRWVWGAATECLPRAAVSDGSRAAGPSAGWLDLNSRRATQNPTKGQRNIQACRGRWMRITFLYIIP